MTNSSVMILVHLVIILFFRTGCSGTQTWNAEPSNTEVNPEGTVVLACRIYNKQGTCSWQKDGKPQGMFVGKYEWAGDRSGGDCSIRIFDAQEVDDGDWECQITASSFTAHDALTSRIARLIVRVAPRPPKLEVASHQVGANQNFTVREDKPGNIKCVSRFGNPPANIKWFIGDEEIPASSYEQTNITEVENGKTWAAYSELNHRFSKAQHGTALRCVAYHQAYRTQTSSKAVQAILDVQYAPTVTLEGGGGGSGDMEEGVDDITLGCLVDANPSANVVWKMNGSSDVFSFQPKLTFRPVERRNSGTYICEARNAVGVSEPASVTVDILYAAHVVTVTPTGTVTVTLHNDTMMQCHADANPTPRYTWIQTIIDTDKRIIRGHNTSLLLEHISYEHQGVYHCIASTTIKGQPREIASQPIILEVQGAPQVLQYTVERNMKVEKGEDAHIQIIFCSDPQPSRTTWEWGSIHLEAGYNHGRYKAHNLAQDGRDDCYTARLVVEGVDTNDATEYILNVHNDKGFDRYAVALHVTERASMSTMICVIVACLVLLVLVTIFVIYAFKTEKCCFAQRGNFQLTDIESEKSDQDREKETKDNGHTNGSSKLMQGNEKQQQQEYPTEKKISL